MAEERRITGERRDYTHQIVRVEPAADKHSSLARPKPVKKLPKRFMLSIIVAVLLIAGGAGALIYLHQTTSASPVPKNITKSVGFPVYYPDQKLLPAGYTLNPNSFSSGDGVVVYSVNTSSGKKVAFTVQARPSDQDIQGFYKAHMPLNTTTQTSLGTATIGVINSLNVYSLPTTDAWLIISTSLQLKDAQIKDLLQSLTKP